MTDNYAKRIIEKAKAENDIIMGVDGFYVYWPHRTGAYTAYDLRMLADELDRLNEPYQNDLDAYFEEHQND